MMLGAISAAGNHYINENAKSLGRAGKIASSAVLGGTVSEIGGGKFANGAITGAFSMMFNDLMHPKTWHIWFKGKNARHRAYEYMLRRSKEMGIEIAAINLENNEVLVYKEVGNTETSSFNYFDNEKSNEFTFRYKGKKHTVLALGEVHTHPIWDPNSNRNPLMISDLDYDLAIRRFEGTINILVVPTKQLFNVDVRFKNRTNLNEVEW